MLRAEAGTRPGGRGTSSLLRQRKVPKRKATPSLRPLRCATGQPASGRLRGAPQNSLRCFAASFKQLRRVSSRGMRARAPMLTPQPPRRRRSQQGFGQPNSRTAEQPYGPLLRSAQSAQRVALAPVRWGRAQRSEAMARMDVVSPAPLYAPRSAVSSATHPVREHHRLPQRAALGTQTAGSPFLW